MLRLKNINPTWKKVNLTQGRMFCLTYPGHDLPVDLANDSEFFPPCPPGSRVKAVKVLILLMDLYCSPAVSSSSSDNVTSGDDEVGAPRICQVRLIAVDTRRWLDMTVAKSKKQNTLFLY